jgi:hypothetical protein
VLKEDTLATPKTGSVSFLILRSSRRTQMLHPDQYYLLMSLYGFEAGLALIFTLRMTAFLFNCMSPVYMRPAYPASRE